MATKVKEKPTSSISNRAILVSVSIGQWDARKIDKPETNAVQAKHNTVKRAARVHKSLLPGAKELEAIHKYSGDIRTFVYKHTLPWADGVQILRTEGYFDFTSKLSAMRNQWHELVNEFIDRYPALIRQAEYNLGTMFDPTDYPAQSDLRAKFVIDTRYLPVPEANDWRVDLSDETIDDLRANIERQLKDSQAVAMKEAWSRLFKVVEHAHERLSQPTAIFRDSLIDNAIEICNLLPTLNITGDPELENLRRKIESTLCAHDPKTLRKNPVERRDTADQLAKAMDKMRGFYGS